MAAALLLALVGGLGLPPCLGAAGLSGAGEAAAVFCGGCCGSVEDPGGAEGSCACLSCLQIPGITSGPALRPALAATYYRSQSGSVPASAFVPPPLRVPIA